MKVVVSWIIALSGAGGYSTHAVRRQNSRFWGLSSAGERRVRIAEAIGSNPIGSTTFVNVLLEYLGP